MLRLASFSNRADEMTMPACFLQQNKDQNMTIIFSLIHTLVVSDITGREDLHESNDMMYFYSIFVCDSMIKPNYQFFQTLEQQQMG
jgi:hypothetical protein